MRSSPRHLPLRIAALTALALLTGCRRPAAPAPAATHEEPPAAATNRIDIPGPVRTNLGIRFAKVEPRAVATTLRMPGRFELLPTARREYRVPLEGRIELLVAQYDRVDLGTPLFRVDSSAWRQLLEDIQAMRAKVESMEPLRRAHRVHEQSLAEKVEIWRARIVQLEELQRAGGGSAALLTDARATLNATQAELADVMEKDASLEAEERIAHSNLRALESRREVLLRTFTALDDGTLEVRAITSGVVDSIAAVSGALLEPSEPLLSVVQPERIRLRATGLQADLGRLEDGLRARIVPPEGGSLPADHVMEGTLRLDLAGDPDERTIDLIVEPGSLAPWARAGISAHVEITLPGGVEELAIPLAAVVRDGATPIIFRRDPANPDKVIRLEADVGVSDGRWIAILSGVREGDEIVVAGNYQLMLATSGSAPKGGHFHPDGTFHEGEH